MTPYLEIGGDYREIVPGIYLVELPLPFSLGLVNVYLVRLAEGYLLVDCGMESDPCFQALTRAREGLELEWRDIRQILLTHVHPDHMGLAPKLLQLTGARLHLHAADAKLLAEITADSHPAWHKEILARAGVAPEKIALIHSSMLDVRKNFHRLAPDCVLSGGETFAGPAGPLEVIWTPGHSPGHVCLYERARRILIAGDHMLEHITPNIGWQPDRDALGEFLSSLDRVAQLKIDLILPSHGAPFSGHREWIRNTQEHHAARCNRILALLAGGSKTADDMVAKLWERPLSPFHYRFAIFEVLAHLEYLERRGKLRSHQANGVVCWAAAG